MGGKGSGESAFHDSRRGKGPFYFLIKNRTINRGCLTGVAEPFTKCIVDVREMVAKSDDYSRRSHENEMKHTCDEWFKINDGRRSSEITTLLEDNEHIINGNELYANTMPHNGYLNDEL